MFCVCLYAHTRLIFPHTPMKKKENYCNRLKKNISPFSKCMIIWFKRTIRANIQKINKSAIWEALMKLFFEMFHSFRLFLKPNQFVINRFKLHLSRYVPEKSVYAIRLELKWKLAVAMLYTHILFLISFINSEYFES